MKIKKKFLILLLVFIPLVVLAVAFFGVPEKVLASHSRVDLLSSDNFAVLAGTAVTGTNTNVVSGDVGLSPTTGAAITLLTCAEMSAGVIYDVDGAYAGGGGGSTACRLTNPGLLTTAKNDLTTAYNDAAGRSTTSTVGTELGGTTLSDGTYDSASGTFGITGTLTLDGGGNPNSVFIFKMATTLITASSSTVSLINGAHPCNVYWQVGSSATFGTSSNFVGNVLALTSITDDGGSTVRGRFLARNGAVTLNNTTITRQACASTSSSGGSSSSALAACPAADSFVAPTIITSSRIDADSVFISWGPFSGINTFTVQYGFQDGNWLFSTNVTGFSTTINDLPPNQPIWVRVGVRDNCIGVKYGASRLVGGPGLPNTGYGRLR